MSKLSKKPDSIPAPDKPQRLFYGWVIVGVAFLIGFTQAGVFQNILSIFMKPMALEFGWNRSFITGAIAVGSLGGGLVSPFIGPFLDRHGPRKVAFWGILILSLGLVALSGLSQIWQLYLFFGMGRLIAVGLLSLVTVVCISNWFERKRGRAMGIAQLGSRFGTAALPPLVQAMILSFGWRFAWAALGIVVFLLSAIPSLLFLKRRPEDMGLRPDGEGPDTATSDSLDAAASGIPKAGREGADRKTEPLWERKQIFRTRAFWLLLIVSSIMLFGGAGTNFHLYPFMTDQGLSPAIAVMVISTVSVCSAFGGLLTGFLAERFSVKHLLAVALASLGIVFVSIFPAVGHPTLIFSFAVVFGLLRGGVMPLLPLIWVEFYGSRSSGTVMGLGGPFRLTANALGPVFGALCFDAWDSYRVPFLVFPALFVLAGLVTLITTPPTPDLS
ncbi:MAG: MFS transporter [Proteobacteria bacterium]|nr:MFS transporter [Pseudomonadota bacterium]